jgi:hypothetical protein
MDRFRMRWAYLGLVNDLRPDTFVTLTTNDAMSVGRFKRKIKDFFGRFDRVYLGPRWIKMPFKLRTDGVGYIEHKNSNIHAHFALCTPPNAYLWNIKIHTEKYWGKICPSGSHDVQMITNAFELTGYNTKEQIRQDYDWHDQVILLRDFAS